MVIKLANEGSVIVERDGPIGRLVLNRPDKGNALSFADADFLVSCLHSLEEDDDIKVIILKGRGPSFCVGHDFDEIVKAYGIEAKQGGPRPSKPSQRKRIMIDRKLAENYMAFQYSIKPVIAQVHGWAVGMGMYMAELVDLVVCSDDAKFSHAEQRLGFAGNTWHLATEILLYGPKKARELLLFGSEFSGTEAERIGLANISVPAEHLEATAEEWAERVARNPKDALVIGKAIHQMALDSLGATQQFYRGYVGHTLGTNIRFESDEFNFFRHRRDHGTKEAFRSRDEQWNDE